MDRLKVLVRQERLVVRTNGDPVSEEERVEELLSEVLDKTLEQLRAAAMLIG
ncbi:MAG: hypothetical protein GTO41_18470 [Burkholderiales bacterium]|nr:hypothetical protein [Burkholderiales bacterium]